ncbi:MAG: GDP-mannose 4,6-dehydratase, partial [Treponema sp.]|nr:GDP-mannose 4,6-dehydratase [Treponema sp.]
MGLSNLLITGGAGFIGTNFIRLLLTRIPAFTGRIVNLDALTYAGNAANLADLAEEFQGRYFFEPGDIRDPSLVPALFERYDIDTVVHFAAESHVDRSILSPDCFIKTNVMGTFNLLEAARHAWQAGGEFRRDVRFHHVSTDEVYGSLGETGAFT